MSNRNSVLDLTKTQYPQSRHFRSDLRDPQGLLPHRTHLRDPQGLRVDLQVAQATTRGPVAADLQVAQVATRGAVAVDLQVAQVATRGDLTADPQAATRGAAVEVTVAATTVAMMPTSLATWLLILRVGTKPTGITEDRWASSLWRLFQQTPMSSLIGQILPSARLPLLQQIRQLVLSGFVKLSIKMSQKRH